MKKFLFLGALAAMLLGTVSCSNDMEPAMTDDGTVQFTIELPGNVDSRAISDGLNATELQVAVYKVKDDGTRTLLNDISLLGDKKVTMSNKKATVNFKLVKGQKYSFAFWAQKPGCEAYTFDAATGKVTVDYSKAVANVDDGDAFSNTTTLKVTGPMNETIYLYRPFAQLNYGDVMADYTAATAAGIDFKQTKVTVKQVATEFDIMNQTTSSENLVDVTWPAAASAIGENLNVENVDYKWLSMCYFLVPSDQANVETELSLLNTAGTAFNTIKVSNVPVQKNHRTNILGNLFTDDVNFNIIIDERFQQPDNNIVMLSDPAAIAEAVTVPNAVVNIEPGTNVNLDLSTIAEGVTINGNGAKLNITGKNTLSAENVTIDNVELINETNTNNKFINVTASNVTLKNVKINDNAPNMEYGIYLDGQNTDGNVIIENCEVTAKRIFRCIMLNNKGTLTIKDSKFGEATYGHYAFNTNTPNAKLTVQDTEFIGWVSFNGVQEPTFTGCTFNMGRAGYGYLCPYVNTQMTDCTFEWVGESEMNPYQHYLYGPRNACTTTFTNCKWSNGTDLNDKVLATDADRNYINCVATIGTESWKNQVVDGVQKWVKL